MKKEVQRAWAAELKSGKFAQGKNTLRKWNEDEQRWEYCCLGVLCEMSGLGEWVEDPTDDGERICRYLFANSYLPPGVAEWAGLHPRYTNRDHLQAKLSQYNDKGYDFLFIGQVIEELPLDAT